MASWPVSVPLNVEQLLDGFEQLSATEQREFQFRLAARQVKSNPLETDEAALLQAARARLPAAAERRLRRLIARSERGQLTAKELAAYQSLAQEVQRLDTARAEALAELGRRRDQSVQTVMTEIESQGCTDGA